jgi:hypothetical protein
MIAKKKKLEIKKLKKGERMISRNEGKETFIVSAIIRYK